MEGSTSLEVTILVPQHVSAAVPPTLLDDPSRTFLVLHVWESAGIAWRGLVPLLLEASPSICHRMLSLLLFQKSNNSLWQRSSCRCGIGTIEPNASAPEDIVHSSFFTRRIRLRAPRKKNTRSLLPVWLLLNPPVLSHPDYIFASVVLRTEHSLIKRQTLTAWWSTLGGGYFFCKRLGVSLQLARQQKALALQIGNISMARQCQINEAYNLMYAGKFRAAKLVLKDLEEQVLQHQQQQQHSCGEDGSLTLQQCHAARIFVKRLKQVKKQGLKGYRLDEAGEKHTVDDYQRIRIVEG